MSRRSDCRRPIWWGVVLSLCLIGCDEQTTKVAPAPKPAGPPEPPVRRLDQEAQPSTLLQSSQSSDAQSRGELGGPIGGPSLAGKTSGASPQERRAETANRSPLKGPSGHGTSGLGTAYPAKLSAGVALPQSLPTGTAMAMSVDYVLQGPLPTSAVQTVWVIEAARGGTAALPVPLKTNGNLMTFVTTMKPDDGPFQSYLAVIFSNRTRQPISAKVEMRSP